jgi:hypothetical protein
MDGAMTSITAAIADFVLESHGVGVYVHAI